jgi:hypothetical protein
MSRAPAAPTAKSLIIVTLLEPAVEAFNNPRVRGWFRELAVDPRIASTTLAEVDSRNIYRKSDLRA